MTPPDSLFKRRALEIAAVLAAALAAGAALLASVAWFVRRRPGEAAVTAVTAPVLVSPPLPISRAAVATVSPAPLDRTATPARALAAAGLALVACLCMLVSAALFAQLRFYDWTRLFSSAVAPVAACALGILALGGALRWSPWRMPFIQPAQSVQTGDVARAPLLAAILLLALGTVFGGRLIEALPALNATLQFALLLAGILLTGWALGGAPRRRPQMPGREGWLVLGLTALALVLRLVEVSATVPGFLDEIHHVHGMRALWDDPAAPLLRQVSTFLPATILFSYWNVLAVDLFGRTLEGLRFVNGVFGALTVPVVYFLARSLFDRRTALAAALLAVAFPPHLHFSRIILPHIADPLFGALTLGFFGLALRGGQRWAWAWGGVALGLTQYFFEGGRLVFPSLVLVWFGFLIVTWGPRRIRPHLRGMATGLLAAVLIAAPMYVTMAATGAPFSSRLNDSGAEGIFEQLRAYTLQDPYTQFLLMRRVASPFLAYVALPDSTGGWYGNDHAMVLPILVPLLLLGVGFSLWRLRSPASVVLLAVLAISAGNILVLETLWYPRYIVAMPLLPVLMAMGLRYMAPMLWPRARLPESPAWLKAGAALVPAVAAVIMLAQVAYFFGPYQAAYAVSWRASDPRRDTNDAALRAANLPAIGQTQAILIGRSELDVNVPRGLLGFLADSAYPLQTAWAPNVTPEWAAALPRDRGYAFFLEPGDVESYRALADAFDLGSPLYSTLPLIPVDEAMILFLVPPPEPAAAN